MSDEEKLKIEQECLLKYSKAKMIEKYINTLEEKQQLKDNWSKLKEYLNEGTFYYKTGNGEYTTEMVGNRINGLDTLRKMQELEKGDKQ